MTEFTVEGKPVGKQRPRVTRFGAYTPEKTKNYEAHIKWLYRSIGGKMYDGAVGINITAYIPIPSRIRKAERLKMKLEHTPAICKPDGDNILKTVKDALNGLAYKDDAQVADERIVRYYSDVPRIEVTLWEIQGGKE